MATAAAALVGAPGALAVAAGLACAVAGIGDLIALLVMERFERIGRGVAEQRTQLERMLVDQFVDKPTHGWFADAEEALAAAQSRFARRQPAAVAESATIGAALKVIEEIEHGLRTSWGSRSAWPDGPPTSASGVFAASIAGEEPGTVARLYGDPSNMPDWLGPRGRNALARFGAILDDVRLLPNARIEWAVLLFTLWTRAVLVCGAPLLAGVSLGIAPLEHGWAPRDMPWVLVSVWSAVTAFAAPWIATAVMRRDENGARARRWLLVVEMPLAIAAILCTPCWPVVVFAAGWTNWWQRPDPSLLRYALWIGLVAAGLTAGMAVADSSSVDIFAEFAISMTAVAIMGGSYGAMLPLSASVLARAIASGVVTSRRARARADDRLREAVKRLDGAADAIEHGADDDALAGRDARHLRECARALSLRADAGDRAARRPPLGLRALIGNALCDEGVMTDSPKAIDLLEEATLAGEPEPVSIAEPVFHQRRLAGARLRERRDAKALRLLVREVAREARRHGTGPLMTVCRIEDDRVLLQFANAVRPGPGRAGRGTGKSTLSRLAAALPDGRIDLRRRIPGSFVDLPSEVERFGVQASFRADALDGIEENQP